MTDTYRIKPLVWGKRGVAEQDGFYSQLDGRIHAEAFVDGRWRLVLDNHVDGSSYCVRGGQSRGLDAAKLAAEAACRELLMGALEPVETPSVPQNQS